MSMFPRVIFNVVQSSVRRGLAEDGTRFQIPFQAAKSFGRLHVDAEFGPRASTVWSEANGYMELSAGLILPNQRC